MKQANHTAMAMAIWCGSWNMFRIKAIVEGMSVAPATPRRARATISISGLVE